MAAILGTMMVNIFNLFNSKKYSLPLLSLQEEGIRLQLWHLTLIQAVTLSKAYYFSKSCSAKLHIYTDPGNVLSKDANISFLRNESHGKDLCLIPSVYETTRWFLTAKLPIYWALVSSLQAGYRSYEFSSFY